MGDYVCSSHVQTFSMCLVTYCLMLTTWASMYAALMYKHLVCGLLPTV